MKTINRIQAATLLVGENSGVFFSVDFVKKDNTLRHMVCRKGVISHLKGGVPAYNALEKGLVTVFDVQKNAYRSISVSTVKHIKMHGEEYDVED